MAKADRDRRGAEKTNEETDLSFGEILSQFESEQAASKPPAEAAGPRGRKAPAQQQAREGRVVGISGDYVLVDFGSKSEGIIPTENLRDPQGNLSVKPGDSFPVAITGRNPEGYVTLSRITGPRPRDWKALEEAFQNKTVIAGRVTGATKGGLTVDVGARAFMPASRSGAREATEMAALVGQEIRCRIIQFEPDEENVVVDRRAVLEEEAAQARETAMAAIEEGAVVRGTVRSLMDYGAFVDLGGVDGLLHVGDMSWSRVTDPRSEMQVGDTLDLKVLKIDRDTGKVALGLKQMYPDPWQAAAQELQAGERVRGTITRLTDFGAFVEVRPGVEGLIHVSEMSWTKRVRKPSDVLKKGEDIEAVVLKVDGDARRLSLGLKQVLGNPWDTIDKRYPGGMIVEGTVRRLTKFGAFVEVEEGIEGLIHISDFTNERRLDHPSEVVRIDQKVRAMVLEADPEKRRLKLGMKQLEATTVDEFLREHKAGDRVMGRVLRVQESAATIQLGEGVEGVCPLKDGIPVAATAPAQAEPKTALAAALAAVWKGPLPSATVAPPEPLREGQMRSFVIQRMDAAGKSIELATA